MSTQAVTAFMGLDEDGQRQALSSMSPDAKQRLLAAIKGQPLPPTMTPPQARASLVQSMAMQARPRVPQPQMETSALGDIYHKESESIQTPIDVIKNLGGGALSAVGNAMDPMAPTKMAVSAASDPSGTVAGAFGIDKLALAQAAATRDYPALAHQVLSPIGTVLTGALLGRLVPKAGVVENRVNKLSYATGASGSSVDVPTAIKTALPDLDAAAAGRPVETVGDLYGTVKSALGNTENEFNLALQPIRTQQTVPQTIADSIRNSLKSNKTVADQRIARMLDARATEFERPWSIGELNQERMNANARLKAFYKAEASGQMARGRTQADVMADEAIANGTRDLVYDAMQQAHGRDFRGLKQRQASLIDLNDLLDDRVRELANQTAAQKGAPRFSGENISVYGRPEAGHLGTSIHSLQRIFTKNIITPQSTADAAVRGAFTPQANVYGMPITVLMPKGKKSPFAEPPTPPDQAIPGNPPPTR